MNKSLNKSRIDYILFHLNKHANLNSITDYFVFGQETIKDNKPFIHFPLSTSDIDKNFRINDLPVLYPLSDDQMFFHFDENKNLVFNHDLLKSAFYLLSGYQETKPFKGDHLGRFTYNDSIQKELNIADQPVVNEYFNIIIDALKQFCSIHGIKFEERILWGDKNFGLFLTHDVDRVDKWTFMEIKIRFKMVVRSLFLKHWAYLLEAISNYKSGKNPYWNFKWMKNLEKKLGFNSTWFFLPQGHPQIDAYYSFSEDRIKELANYFVDCDDEIALHGTYISREDQQVMQNNLTDVQTLSPEKIKTSRQHWLSFKHPQTLRILENLGIENDSSWGFAEHYGWRNSYCLPFHPYDVENDRMMNIWELPLCAMDVTFFQYMGFSLDEAMEAFEKMIETCKKYNGLFVLLWHNSHFNETIIPGITNFYQDLLKKIADNHPNVVKAKQI